MKVKRTKLQGTSFARIARNGIMTTENNNDGIETFIRATNQQEPDTVIYPIVRLLYP